MINCIRCQNPYEPIRANQKYCSTSCRNVASVSRWRQQNMKKCSDCESLILPESTKCRECQTHSTQKKQMTLLECKQALSIKGKHPSWASANVRLFNRSWNKNLLNCPCQVCGYDKHIELAHIKPIHKFADSDLVSVINHPDNILVLCRNHHWEFDSGLLLLCNIPPR